MRVLFLLFFLGVTLYGGHPDVQKRLEKVSLQLHWKYQFQFAGFIAAKEKGFYEEVGLDVELKEYQFATDIVQEVLSKRANYGIYNSNILVSYLHNKDIKLLSSYFKRSALVLIVQPEINFPSDLIDKKIMAAGKEDFLLNFKSLLSEYNLALNELHLVEHSYGIDEFVDGK
ncbi:ABC transporter substrate-binding protein, partial [bacterium]|nr:ABC transporter substrate-binding protein [bacterium]